MLNTAVKAARKAGTIITRASFDVDKLTIRTKRQHDFVSEVDHAAEEAIIRTLKEEVVWLRDWESADELRAALEAWLVRYNTTRPHQALGWLTPSEYRAQKLGGVKLRAAA